MFHYFGTVTNTKGDSLSGWQIECVQLADGTTPVAIYADENGTPISSVSGISNRAKSDDEGNYDFFVAEGLYSIRHYDAAGTYKKTQRYIPMYGMDTAAASGTQEAPSDLVVIGDSITASDTSNINNQQKNSWVTHLTLQLGGKVRLVRNSGIGGNTTAQMLARFNTDVIAYLPNGGWVGIMAGTNDADGVTDTYANVEGMIGLARAAGLNVFLLTPPPQGMAALPTPSAPTVTASLTGGTLISGTYSYKIAAINIGGAGTTLCSAAATATVASGTTGSCTITWPHVQGATQYKIYGRTAGSELLIATVSPGPSAGAGCNYTDTGSVTPAGAQPGANTTAIARISASHIKLGKVRQSLERLSRKYGLPLINTYSVCADSASGGGGMYYTGATTDGTHPTAKYQALMGQYAAVVLSPYLQPVEIPFPLDNGNPNGLTGNTLFQTHDTIKPNGWTVFGGGGTESIASNASIVGGSFKVVNTTVYGSARYGTGPIISCTAGQRYLFVGKLQTTIADTNFATCTVQVQFLPGSVTPNTLASISVNTSTNGMCAFQFECVAPAGVTGMQFLTAVSYGPATLEVGQCEIYNLTALGLS